MATPEEMYSEKERELLRLREARTASGQLQRSAPAEFMPTTAVGVPGGETIPNPPAPDMKRMVKDTSEAQSQLRKDAPSVLTDEQKLMAGGAAGLGLLGWLASKFISGTDSDQPPGGGGGPRDRYINREPTMDQNFKGPQEPSFLPEPTPAQPQPAAQPAAQTPVDDYRLRAFEEDQRRKNELHDLEVQKRKAELEIKKSKAAVPAPVTTAMPVEPAISREQAAARLAEMPEHPNPITKVEPSTLSQIGSSNLAAQTKEAIEEQKKSKSKSDVKEIHTYKSIADIPEGTVFRPDVGNLDRSLVNILGPEHRLYAKELINEGKMFGHSNDVNKDVSKLTSQYFKALQGQVPETLLSRDARKAQGVESKFGTYGKALGKAATVGGVAGTLMTIAQSANAKEAANALGEALLPLGATPSAVEPGTLTAKQLKAFEEAQKRGSPYRSVPPPTR